MAHRQGPVHERRRRFTFRSKGRAPKAPDGRILGPIEHLRRSTPEISMGNHFEDCI